MRKIAYCMVSIASILTGMDFKLGIENIEPALIKQYHKMRIGLVTNQTGKDNAGNRTVDILLKKGFNITYLFAPEHGIDGKIHAEKEVKDCKDSKTNVPVLSLYTSNGPKKMNEEALKNIDAIFFDIQDSGMRHYTYISTLFQVLKAAAQENKKMVVFDRPNPLGKIMEGPLVDPGLISFISIAAIPLRHGMTIGELAEYFNASFFEQKAALHVVPMKNYDRTTLINVVSSPLSPNIASLASCHGYCFLGLLGEVAPFDVGVGTSDAFQIITLSQGLGVTPAAWQILAAQLKTLGVYATPHSFFNERKKEDYHGLRLRFSNMNQVNGFMALLKTIAWAKKVGKQFDFRSGFDKAVGTKNVRLFLTGQLPYQDLIAEINLGLQQFFVQAQPFFKYLPHPEPLF